MKKRKEREDDNIKGFSAPRNGDVQANNNGKNKINDLHKEYEKPLRITVKEFIKKQWPVNFDFESTDTQQAVFIKAILNKDDKRFDDIYKNKKLSEDQLGGFLGSLTYMASRCRDIEILKFLINKKIDVNNLYFILEDTHFQRQEEDYGELNKAFSNLKVANSENKKVIEKIYFSPIYLTLTTNVCNLLFFDEDLFNLLIKNGANLNEKKDGMLIFSSIIKHAPEKYLSKLLDNIKIENCYLYEAINAKKYELAKALISKGADINSADNDFGVPVIFIEIWKNEVDLQAVKFIIDAGAEINIYNKFGKSLCESIYLMKNTSIKDEVAKIVVSTGKLALSENESSFSELSKYFNEIKEKVENEIPIIENNNTLEFDNFFNTDLIGDITGNCNDLYDLNLFSNF